MIIIFCFLPTDILYREERRNEEKNMTYLKDLFYIWLWFIKVFIDTYMGSRILSFNADTLKSCSVVAAAGAALLKHQWCIVAACSASLFLMDIIQPVKGKGSGNAGNWRNRSCWASLYAVCVNWTLNSRFVYGPHKFRVWK